MSLIPLTHESLRKMYKDLYRECGYLCPIFDYSAQKVEIYVEGESVVVEFCHHGPCAVKTWEEWKRLLNVDFAQTLVAVSLIPLTQESVKRMYTDLYHEYNYTCPNFYDNRDDYPAQKIEIFVEGESMAVEFWNHGRYVAKTWKEWGRLLNVDFAPIFDRPVNESGDDESNDEKSDDGSEDEAGDN